MKFKIEGGVWGQRAKKDRLLYEFAASNESLSNPWCQAYQDLDFEVERFVFCTGCDLQVLLQLLGAKYISLHSFEVIS